MTKSDLIPHSLEEIMRDEAISFGNYVLEFPTCSRSSRVSPLSLGPLGPLSLLVLKSSRTNSASN